MVYVRSGRPSATTRCGHMLVIDATYDNPLIKFLMSEESKDLSKYQLSDAEWDALQIIANILSVPHAFQQLLSSEQTPTLGYTIPSFQAMIMRWQKMQDQMPSIAHIIQAGLDKLEGYQDRLDLVPANVVATILTRVLSY
ncbi:hypothetical protein D9613_012718 [Agrocybe pediades]|uniref:Uncharacterized protein n=1 Tax=Agrocybe pediades TaxID=84607 RepID=A0A8H4QLI7_9AGAR|nr:hypothetical protein D9613_012718 [Agrocybe pediades]